LVHIGPTEHEKIVCDIPIGRGTSPVLLTQESGETSTSPAFIVYEQCEPGTVIDGLACLNCSKGYFSASLDASLCIKCDPVCFLFVLVRLSFSFLAHDVFAFFCFVCLFC
jgi:hypothetical protein